MIQRGSSFGFASEALERRGALRSFRREEFQRDEALQASVFSFVDDAHATAAQLL